MSVCQRCDGSGKGDRQFLGAAEGACEVCGGSGEAPEAVSAKQRVHTAAAWLELDLGRSGFPRLAIDLGPAVVAMSLPRARAFAQQVQDLVEQGERIQGALQRAGEETHG